MKYKIVTILFEEEWASVINIIDCNNHIIAVTNEIFKRIKVLDWAGLKLYGVHIFETDNLETFDLMEAQREKDRKQSLSKAFEITTYEKGYADGFRDKNATVESNRKAEIMRLAERLLIEIMNVRTDLADINACIKCAKGFVDNFDAEFEKLEKGE